MKITKLLLFVAYLSFFNACGAVELLKISTTTSTENSGLLAVLNPAFEAKYKIKIHMIAVGTGKALKIGGNGDVDVVLVHAPAAELKHVEQGDFIDRTAVMHNDFVIVGPANDSSGIASVKTITEALSIIADKQLDFISRGDDSGTHKKELQLWTQTGIVPKGDWYISVGQGMAAALRIADDKQAYILTDRGTQIAYSDKMSLTVKFEGETTLFNPYHIMAVNPKKHHHARYDLAKKYIDFVTGREGQAIINAFRKEGEQLFYPDAIVDANFIKPINNEAEKRVESFWGQFPWFSFEQASLSVN